MFGLWKDGSVQPFIIIVVVVVVVVSLSGWVQGPCRSVDTVSGLSGS